MPPAVATARQLTQQGMNAMERGDWKRAESLLARAQTFPTMPMRSPQLRRNAMASRRLE